MSIRDANDQDIPAIVELLKLSLGESLMPKSEAFWRWKHIDNPFGKSPVLVAVENDQLIGVRAFMRWEWRQGDKIYKSVRAVDTVTHPSHQGKGIFKKLTLQLVEKCRAEGVDFIFNTPNKKSKPGYLKMGWRSNGNLRLHIKPVIPWRKKALEFDSIYSVKNNSGFRKEKSGYVPSGYLSTFVSQKFLNWRYSENPNIQYYAVSDENLDPAWLVIFRLKPYRFGLEFRICEVLQFKDFNNRSHEKQLLSAIRSSGANVVTSATDTSLFPTAIVPVGPEITTYPLTFDHNFLSFNFWKPSLGDLEVF